MLIATGTGRCGTQTIAKLFDMHHEYRISELIQPWYSANEYVANPWPDRPGTLREHLKNVNLDTHRESNNLYIHFLREILHLSPDSSIVLLIRKREDFIVSAMAHGWHKRNIYSVRPAKGWPEHWMDERRCAWIYDYRNTLARLSLWGRRYMEVWTHEIYDQADEIAAFYGVEANKDVLAERKRWNATCS